MSLDGQRLDESRYSLIPRTLSLLVHDHRILLLKLGAKADGWKGLYNGIGGHVERGEDPLTAALREIKEETGLQPQDQRLCGVATIDTGISTGIGLYIFVGHAMDEEVTSSEEGQVAWKRLDRLGKDELVEDLPIIIPRALEAYERNEVFFASYSYSSAGELRITVVE